VPERWIGIIINPVLRVETDRSLIEWQEIGRQAAESLGEERRAFLFWKRSRKSVVSSVQSFVDLVYNTDPSNFSEEQFVTAQDILNDVIDRTQKYLTEHVDHGDTAQFSFLGEVIRQLRDARHWIAQGYSPREDRRPPHDQIISAADDCAASALAFLRSSE
jgi:hypothetical protein